LQNEQEPYLQLMKQLPPSECFHMDRVAEYARMTAIQMNFAKKDVHKLYETCRVHDIGKVQMPSYLLSKEGKLTPEEFDILKLHPLTGAKILQNTLETYEWGKLAFKVALTHHEKFDGTGYPFGLRENQIPWKDKYVL
jgi:putative two-component system response regulator